MPFEQFKLDISSHQSRGIFNQYVYETVDSSVEVLVTGYFDQSRFAESDPDNWFGSLITCKCSDLTFTGELNSDGSISNNDVDLSALDAIGMISGVISGFDVTVNGSDPAQIDVSAGTGIIIDWSTGSRIITSVSAGPFIGVTLTGIATTLFTSLFIDVSGNLNQNSGERLSSAKVRQNIAISTAVHNDFSTITNISGSGVVAYQYGNALFEYIRKLGPINDGNAYSSGGANLSVNKASGTTTLPWINQGVDPQNPTETTNISITPLTGNDWSAFYQDGSGSFTLEPSKSAINPDLWDDGSGTLATVANNQFTVKRFYFFGQNNQTVTTYGQAEYFSLDDAIAAIFTEDPEISPLLDTGTFISTLAVQEGVTDLDAAILAGNAKFSQIQRLIAI